MAIQLLTTATEALKEIYLPLFRDQISTEPTPFLESIKKEVLRGGGSIVAAARYGINGGFGMGAEGQATPTAFAQIYKDFETTAKDMYVDIGISNKTMILAREDKNAFVNAYQDEVKGAYIAAKWNMGRQMFGNGIGKLGTFASALDAATTITLDSVANVIEGLAIDVYNVNGATITKEAESPVRILYVDRVNKAITISAAVTTTHGGFITVQNSYNREITGLGAIFDTTNVTTLFGKVRADNPWINPIVYSAANDVSSRLFYEAVSEAKSRRGAKIDMILMGDAAFKAWYDYMEETHTAFTPESLAYRSGAVGFKVVVGDHTATIVNEPFVPANESWCIEKGAFKFVSTPWDFADSNTGGAFTLVPGQSYYRALLASYGNLICDAPGGCVQITNCNAAVIVRATGITISDATKALSTDNATAQLTAAVQPTTANNTQVRWYSSDPAKATVTATGLVTAIANGTTVITAVAVDGGYVAQCLVTCSNQV